MTDNLFWRNRIVDSGAADPQELAKGYNPDNWRHHPQIQRDALEDALDSIGVLQPVLFNRLSGKVIDGHLRIELAILKGQPLIPVNYVELTDDEEALALATLDAITEQAEPIADKLAALLERTRALTADRPGLGAMLQALKERAGINGHQPKEDAGPQIDKAAELQKVWGVQVGDVWELGQHRLVCGDCTDRATVEAVMSGERADLALTDPPYGVGMEYGMHEDDPEQNESLVIAAFSFCPDSKIWTPGLKNLSRELIREPSAAVLAWNRKFSVGWPPHGCSWATVWEPVLVTKPLVRNLNTDHFEYMTDKFSVGDTPLSKLHPCPKALGLWEELLNGLSEPGMIVYEPFTGSGTTIIAAENLGRKVRAIELDPGYCAVTLERWSQLTGHTPRRVSG